MSLGICFLLFFFSQLSPLRLISPLANSLTKMHASPNDSTNVSMIKDFCSKQKLSCNTIQVEGDTITITMDKNEQVFLSLKKDLQKQLASLQLTIQELTIEGKEFKTLDFRFEKIVAQF